MLGFKATACTNSNCYLQFVLSALLAFCLTAPSAGFQMLGSKGASAEIWEGFL